MQKVYCTISKILIFTVCTFIFVSCSFFEQAKSSSLTFNFNLSSFRSAISSSDTKVSLFIIDSSISNDTYANMRTTLDNKSSDLTFLANDSSCLDYQQLGLTESSNIVSFNTKPLKFGTKFIVLVTITSNSSLLGYGLSPETPGAFNSTSNTEINLSIKVGNNNDYIWLFDVKPNVDDVYNKNIVEIFYTKDYINPQKGTQFLFDGAKDKLTIDTTNGSALYIVAYDAFENFIQKILPQNEPITISGSIGFNDISIAQNKTSGTPYWISTKLVYYNATQPVELQVKTGDTPMQTTNAFCVDHTGNTMFAYEKNDVDSLLQITKYQLNDSDYSRVDTISIAEIGSISSTNLIEFAARSSAFVTDMAYDNGLLWVLISDVTNTFSPTTTITPTKNYSRGALVKIDATTMNILGTYGFTTAPRANLDPAGDSQKFYGPVRFLAVKPKKLYIADDGATIQKMGDDRVDLIQKNRVVIFDIDSSTLTANDTSVEFISKTNVSGTFSLDDISR